MPKLIITADIHGFLCTWLSLKNLLNKRDSLAIAGDLFDTRYGSYSNPNFASDQIKKALKDFKNPLHYVYGNCDTRSFFTRYDHYLIFKYNNKQILLHHGHRKLRVKVADHIDIIIVFFTAIEKLLLK
jgi:uncharacterized protein